MASKIEERVAELERSIDGEVLGAVGASLRGILKKRDKEHADQLTKVALQSIKAVLATFPEATRSEVVKVFEHRMDDARRLGYECGALERLNARQPKDLMPQIKDLLI